MEKLTLKVGNLFIVANRYLGSSNSKRILLLNHATGFCKEVWNPIIEDLRKQGNTDEIVTIDQANHGDSAILNHGKLPNEPHNLTNDMATWPSNFYYDWEWNAQDMIRVMKQLYPKELRKEKKIYGIGHSGGATAMLSASAIEPDLFSGLFVIEPILLKLGEVFKGQMLAKATLRRKIYFKSRQDAFDVLSSRAVFQGCDIRMLKQYAEHGFRDVDPRFDAEKTGVALKCHPIQEAATYLGGNFTHIWDKLGKITAPSYLIAGSDEGSCPQEHLEKFLALVKKGAVKSIPEAGHLVPFQKCTLIAQEITEWINSLELKTKL